MRRWRSISQAMSVRIWAEFRQASSIIFLPAARQTSFCAMTLPDRRQTASDISTIQINPHSTDEIELVAARMRQTLIEVLGEEEGTALSSMDWLSAFFERAELRS